MERDHSEQNKAQKKNCRGLIIVCPLFFYMLVVGAFTTNTDQRPNDESSDRISRKTEPLTQLELFRILPGYSVNTLPVVVPSDPSQLSYKVTNSPVAK